MSTGYGGDIKANLNPRPSRSPTNGTSIGEIPFFLEIPANPDFEELEERERAIAEIEHDKP